MGESPYAVRAEHLWFSYAARNGWTAEQRGTAVLQGISLEVPPGGLWCVFGPSGAGKTTLLKLLAGLLIPQRGRVELLGHDTREGVPLHLRLQAGYIPQQLGLVRGLTALENVLLGSLGRSGTLATLAGRFPGHEVERAREYLEMVGIGHKAGEKVFRLSGGERQRVAIARTLLQGPRVIFADEFVSDLDLPRAAQVLGLMRQFAERQGIAFVLNLHEVEPIQSIADHSLILKDGRIVHRGAARELSAALLHEALR